MCAKVTNDDEMRPVSRPAIADNPLCALRKRWCRRCDRAHARPFAANDTEMRQPVSQLVGSSYYGPSARAFGVLLTRVGLAPLTTGLSLSEAVIQTATWA